MVIIHLVALFYVSVKAYLEIILQKTICMRDRPEMIIVLAAKTSYSLAKIKIVKSLFV